MLSSRLFLALNFLEACDLGADIGTDHALLPCEALKRGIFQRMILSDASEKALMHARENVHTQGLEDRVTLVCADGLQAISAPCGCISMTGIGGITCAEILRAAPEKLHGATLVISPHRDESVVRETLQTLSYHLTRETLCLCEGRYYIVMQAKPGRVTYTKTQMRYGVHLFDPSNPDLRGFLKRQIALSQDRLASLQRANDPSRASIARITEDIQFYEEKYKELFT